MEWCGVSGVLGSYLGRFRLRVRVLGRNRRGKRIGGDSGWITNRSELQVLYFFSNFSTTNRCVIINVQPVGHHLSLHRLINIFLGPVGWSFIRTGWLTIQTNRLVFCKNFLTAALFLPN